MSIHVICCDRRTFFDPHLGHCNGVEELITKLVKLGRFSLTPDLARRPINTTAG